VGMVAAGGEGEQLVSIGRCDAGIIESGGLYAADICGKCCLGAKILVVIGAEIASCGVLIVERGKDRIGLTLFQGVKSDGGVRLPEGGVGIGEERRKHGAVVEIMAIDQ